MEKEFWQTQYLNLKEEYEQLQQEIERYKKYVLYYAGKDKVNDIRIALEDGELD